MFGLARKSIVSAVVGGRSSICTNYQFCGVRTFASTAVSKLQNVLGEEIKHEKENYEKPDVISKILSSGVWKFKESPRDVNMSLECTVNGNKVIVEFQLLPSFNEPDFGDFEGQDGKEDSMEGPPGTPVDFTVSIEKKDQTGIQFFCSTSPGEDHRFTIGNVRTFSNAADRENLSLYNGPEFEDLVEGLQTAFDEFLGEHGIDASLCDFIDAAATDKEQREYQEWLSGIQKFLS